jgi:branched-chain amino acid transport system permease protein
MSALGSPVRRRLIAIYTISGAIAGLAGALLSQTTQFVGLEVLGFSRSADLLIMVVLGGAGWLYGGLIGAAIFMIAQSLLSGMNPVYWQFWLGLLLILAVFFSPGGIGGTAVALRRRLSGRST